MNNAKILPLVSVALCLGLCLIAKESRGQVRTQSLDSTPFSNVPTEFILKRVSGRDSPDDIPEYVSIRVYLTTFEAATRLFKTPEEHLRSIALTYDLPSSQASAMREMLLEIHAEDERRLSSYTSELCSPMLRQRHTAKSTDKFLSYMQSRERSIDQELARDFTMRLQAGRLDESTATKIRAWIETHIIPSITHVEIDKPALYKARNVTPESFIESFCNR
jgi:hypothetical protein